MLKEWFHAYAIIPKFHKQLKYILWRKWVWSGNTTSTHCRPTHSSVRESHRTLTDTRQQKDKQNRAFNSLFSINMNAKLKRTQCFAQQNMERKQNPNNGSNNKWLFRFQQKWTKPMEPLMAPTHRLLLTTVLIRLIIALDTEETCVLILQIGHTNAVLCIADFVKVNVS